ncbi:MAG: hypothetical protein SVM80_00030 [Halobacteriota archaeon]|nr:hypothetical protein [Halobacteriota archaeon]
MIVEVSDLTKALFFSLLSYMSVLFVIIALDTLIAEDFVFGRAIIISAGYMGALFVLFTVMFVVFRKRVNST